MKRLTAKVTNGSLPTSPVLGSIEQELPGNIPDFDWSYVFKKRVWFVTIVLGFYVSVAAVEPA